VPLQLAIEGSLVFGCLRPSCGPVLGLDLVFLALPFAIEGSLVGGCVLHSGESVLGLDLGLWCPSHLPLRGLLLLGACGTLMDRCWALLWVFGASPIGH
jgi:hypothetical protein